MKPFSIVIPDQKDITQDQEFFILEENGITKEIKIHDYDKIFSVPGLYEELLMNKLQCNSPRVMKNVVEFISKNYFIPITEMSVLEIGAGNGLVGEKLRQLDFSHYSRTRYFSNCL
ncbi:MAG: hypothetical protein F6K22_31085 [Okeania sp. SIO2F4]|uniref:hypothetical protein n=1 Tax=Okeania sp. SIO2F4 TaxID=2607790 RepID=UPI00142C779E|nr:hypothetical protein [Okeania sp. SIO2F4]MDJ0516080.1 hypothetical protein [Trichodesmium sp. MO_231.B1]NES06869.1 hypothetical protein [Okeania sp. SIO2F4]